MEHDFYFIYPLLLISFSSCHHFGFSLISFRRAPPRRETPDESQILDFLTEKPRSTRLFFSVLPAGRQEIKGLRFQPLFIGDFSGVAIVLLAKSHVSKVRKQSQIVQRLTKCGQKAQNFHSKTPLWAFLGLA